MKKVNLHSLKSFLKKKGYDAQIQTETDQVYVILKFDNQEFPLFIRILPEGSLIQMLVFFPFNIKKGIEGELARLLHFLNKELDIPGFGMDEAAGVTFFRCMIPTFEGDLSEPVLEGFMQSIQLVCKNFTGAVAAVGLGEMTFQGILDKSKEMGKQAEGK